MEPIFLEAIFLEEVFLFWIIEIMRHRIFEGAAGWYRGCGLMAFFGAPGGGSLVPTGGAGQVKGSIAEKMKVRVAGWGRSRRHRRDIPPPSPLLASCMCVLLLCEAYWFSS